MSLLRKIKKRKKARALRVRDKIKNSQYLRLSVFRSLSNIYAQLIDDKKGITLASHSSLHLKSKKADKANNKMHIAHKVGLEFAKVILDLGINKVVFDRGTYLFHGRIKSLADGLKEGGLEI